MQPAGVKWQVFVFQTICCLQLIVQISSASCKVHQENKQMHISLMTLLVLRPTEANLQLAKPERCVVGGYFMKFIYTQFLPDTGMHSARMSREHEYGLESLLVCPAREYSFFTCSSHFCPLVFSIVVWCDQKHSRFPVEKFQRLSTRFNFLLACTPFCSAPTTRTKRFCHVCRWIIPSNVIFSWILVREWNKTQNCSCWLFPLSWELVFWMPQAKKTFRRLWRNGKKVLFNAANFFQRYLPTFAAYFRTDRSLMFLCRVYWVWHHRNIQCTYRYMQMKSGWCLKQNI